MTSTETTAMKTTHATYTAAELTEEIAYLETLPPCRQRTAWLASARATLAALEAREAEHAAAWAGLE